MKIKVIKILPHDGALKKISFSTSAGCGIALWADELLKENDEYDVEFDIGDDLIWGTSINPTIEKKDKFEIFGDTTKITANIISNEENSLALEIQQSIILIEANSSPLPLPQRVELSAKHITLYPIAF